MLVLQPSSRQTATMEQFKRGFSVVVLCLFFATIQAQRSCTTPNGDRAVCEPIRSCKKLYDAISTQDTQQLKFLRESQCGVYRGNPLVCCGSYDNYHVQNEFGGGWGDEEEDSNWNKRTSPSSNWGSNGAGWGTDDRKNNFGGGWGSDEEVTQPFGGRRPGANSNRGKLPDSQTCGYQAIDRILSGQATELREFPWMALLQYRKKGGNLVFSCGGTLISSRYVLTAAHCVKGAILTKIGPLMNVRLGEHNTDTERDCSQNKLGFEMCSDKPIDLEIDKTVVHPGYSDASADRHDDIALIRLKQEVVFNDFIKPICLPSGRENVRVGDRLVVAGWGRTEYANSSPVKLKLWIPVAELNQCSTKFKSAGVNLGNRQLCAGGERGKDSCNGDSGGPLMGPVKSNNAQWYIQGIVSFGARCGSEGWPGVYTQVGQYLDWIKSNIE